MCPCHFMKIYLKQEEMGEGICMKCFNDMLSNIFQKNGVQHFLLFTGLSYNGDQRRNLEALNDCL